MLLLKQDSPTEADARKINAQCKPSDYQWMLAVPKERVVKIPKPCSLPRCATCNHYKATKMLSDTLSIFLRNGVNREVNKMKCTNRPQYGNTQC